MGDKEVMTTTLMINALEKASGHQVSIALERQRRRRQFKLPPWMRSALMGGVLYLFLPGVIVAYDYQEFVDYTDPRRNGKA